MKKSDFLKIVAFFLVFFNLTACSNSNREEETFKVGNINEDKNGSANQLSSDENQEELNDRKVEEEKRVLSDKIEKRVIDHWPSMFPDDFPKFEGELVSASEVREEVNGKDVINAMAIIGNTNEEAVQGYITKLERINFKKIELGDNNKSNSSLIRDNNTVRLIFNSEKKTVRIIYVELKN